MSFLSLLTHIGLNFNEKVCENLGLSHFFPQNWTHQTEKKKFLKYFTSTLFSKQLFHFYDHNFLKSNQNFLCENHSVTWGSRIHRRNIYRTLHSYKLFWAVCHLFPQRWQTLNVQSRETIGQEDHVICLQLRWRA